MVNVVFNLTDSSGNELFTKLNISPSIAPISTGSSIISSDAVIVVEKGTGVTASLVPNTYSVRAVGFNTLTDFLVTIPSEIDGQTVNASDYLVSSVPTASYTASYAITAGNVVSSSYAATASYAQTTGNVASSSYAVTSSFALNALNTVPDITDRQDGSGNPVIGIGNTNPFWTLDVNGDIGDNTGGGFLISQNADSYFGVNGGYVGINNNAPAYNLDVGGNINFTGTLYKNGSPFSATSQIMIGSYANPNSHVTPADTSKGCLYYQDTPTGNIALWAWSVTNQVWFAMIS